MLIVVESEAIPGGSPATTRVLFGVVVEITCKLCKLKERKQLDRMIVMGAPYRDIQRRFKIHSVSMISYHKGTCLGLIPPRKKSAYPVERPW